MIPGSIAVRGACAMLLLLSGCALGPSSGAPGRTAGIGRASSNGAHLERAAVTCRLVRFLQKDDKPAPLNGTAKRAIVLAPHQARDLVATAGLHGRNQNVMTLNTGEGRRLRVATTGGDRIYDLEMMLQRTEAGWLRAMGRVTELYADAPRPPVILTESSLTFRPLAGSVIAFGPLDGQDASVFLLLEVQQAFPRPDSTRHSQPAQSPGAPPIHEIAP